MSVVAKLGLMRFPLSSRQQHPGISAQGLVASSAITSSGSPRNTTSHRSLRRHAPGVAEECGPIATVVALPRNSLNHCCGTLSSGCGHLQNRYEGALGITRKSGRNESNCRLVSAMLQLFT